MLNSIFTNYFGFNKQQRNGLVVLLCLSFLLLVIRLVYPYFIKPDPIIVKNIQFAKLKPDSLIYSSKTFSHKEYKGPRQDLFVFDPNLVTYEQLLSLGFKEKTAGIFIKFRAKGFIFKNKEDLKKIYGISDKLYASLESYILIAPSPHSSKKTEAPVIPAVAKQTKILELNSADSSALTELSGIGPAYARRIIKYRSMLGGFTDPNQLKEVYGFPEDLFEKIKSSVTVNPGEIKKIDLNKDDFKKINKHPYLSYELTKIIFDWRRKTTLNSDNIKEIINDPVLYAKLLPYLTFE